MCCTLWLLCCMIALLLCVVLLWFAYALRAFVCICCLLRLRCFVMAIVVGFVGDLRTCCFLWLICYFVLSLL